MEIGKANPIRCNIQREAYVETLKEPVEKKTHEQKNARVKRNKKWKKFSKKIGNSIPGITKDKRRGQI